MCVRTHTHILLGSESASFVFKSRFRVFHLVQRHSGSAGQTKGEAKAGAQATEGRGQDGGGEPLCVCVCVCV